jgi:hypothetical protein
MPISYEKALEKALPFNCISRRSGLTSAGQKYTIVINSILWYKVRLFLDEDHLDKGRALIEYHWSHHTTRKGADDAVKRIENRLTRVPLLEYKPFRRVRSLGDDNDEDEDDNEDNPMTVDLRYYFTQVKLPDKCKTVPDKYLKKGDHVYITRKCGIYHHDAIYLGNKRVVHIFGEMSTNTNVKAKEDSWENFVGVNADGGVSWFGTVYVIVYRLRTRSPDKIVSEALQLASDSYGEGIYNFLSKNCQHFASYCCTGKEISLGAHSLSDAIWQSLSGLRNKPSIGNAIEKVTQSPLDKEP